MPASPATDASPAREPGPRVPTPATAELRRHARVTVPRAAADIGEQRRSSRRRVALENPVIAEVTSDGGEGTSAAGRVASLGPEGAYLELSEDYPIGCPLNICFKLPPPPPPLSFSAIICSAIVRSHSPGRGIGVEFTDLMPADRERIKKFVDIK